MLKHLGRMQGKAWGAHAPLDLGGKPWLLKPFYYFFTPSDLTRHDDMAFRKLCNHIWSNQKV